MNRQAIERTVVGVLVAGFTIGTITHILHLVTVGWIVFDDAPVWMNVYWTALTALDPLAAVLLLWRRPAGLALGAAIIVSDVAINSHALYRLGLPFGFLSLQLQTLFCGFLLGAAGFLSPDTIARSPATVDRRPAKPGHDGYARLSCHHGQPARRTP